MGSSVEMARAKRRKAEAAQRKKDQERWNKAKKPLLIALIAIAVIVAGYFIVTGILNAPYRVSIGSDGVVGMQDTWVVKNLGTTKKPAYYHLASMEQPEGYTANPDYDTVWSSSGGKANYDQSRYFYTDDESVPVKAIYVVGIPDMKASDMPDKVKGQAVYFASLGEPASMEIDGRTYYYIINDSAVTDDNGQAVEGRVTSTMYAYTDSVHGACVGICLLHRAHDVGDTTVQDTLLAEFRQVVTLLTVSK